MSLYLATTVLRWLDQAQELIDQHSPVTGRCRACGQAEPCGASVDAQVLLSRYGRLPRRRPGATRPELCGRRRVAFDLPTAAT